MESNNKKGPGQIPSTQDFVRQVAVTREIEKIIGNIPQDNAYLVDLFLEEFVSIGAEKIHIWSKFMSDFIFNAFKRQDFEKVDMLLEKIDIENLSLFQMEYLVKNCFCYRHILRHYKPAVLRIFVQVNENYNEYMYVFEGIFSFENGQLKI